MKILYITISYPLGEKSDNLYSMLVEELTSRGHTVTIAVAEEAKNIEHTKLSYENDIEVLRVKVGDQFGVNLVKKGITTMKIEPMLIRAIKKYFNNREFDVVLYATPPVTFANVIKFCKKKYGCKSYLMLKDIFPQGAVDLGLIKSRSLLHKFFRNKEVSLYNLSDHIGCMSPANREYILKHNDLPSEKIELFPNTIKVLPPQNIFNKSIAKEKHQIPMGKTIFVFGGNLGLPQGINFLIECIEKLRDYEQAFFLIIGEGTERRKIEDQIKSKSITNAKFINRLPKSEYDQLIAECDVGLILLDKRFTIPNFPSRILGYMDMALPVLAATDKVSDIKNLLTEANCGLWAYSGDVEAFITQVKILCEEPENRKQMGQNGRSYLEQNYDVSKSVDILERHFIKNS